ncbi:MAG TPA: hypothetical protein VMR06_08105 [Dokdonella sp.]|uniref:hypothetical protein n=1 Tax=Dokdonella sp. TaxID=2291710 RepID=UPI002C678C09|nr:hypothetical protein [Dokdonella sp.]HUD41946.1 hypothetical protein [Dokdonella sp.]
MEIGIFVAFAAGLFFMLGGIFNFTFINDPPKAMAFFYTHSFLRLFLPVTGMRIFNIILGLCFISVAIIHIIG